MLVVAPLRVARQTWPAEVAKWEDFADLRVAVLHGKDKEKKLREGQADIYVINPEGLPWLCKLYFGRPFPFDVLAIDELTRFKNSQGDRAKAIRARLPRGPRWRWGLTGSLAGDGNYMDVFGQQLMLDDGAALGRFITHYRDKYFTLGYDGFSYLLNRGAELAITERLAPTWFYMDPADYSQLPPLVDNPIMIDMEPKERALYVRMRDHYVAQLPGQTITAANAGAAYSKLSQMANGAVYDTDREVHHIHDAKLQAIDELAEELNGEPALIGYEFNHDLERLQRWHKERYGRELPFLGKGTTPAQETEWVAAWNAGKLPWLAGHPASMGHGLNLQGCNCKNIVHFSLPWSFEYYDQFVGRVRRSGNEAQQIFNHILIVRDTIDDDKLASRDQKDFTSSTLIRVLNDQILRETRETPPGGPAKMEWDMVQRLSRPAGAPQQPPPAQPQQTAAQGWGAPQGQPQQAQPQGPGPGDPQGGQPNGWMAPQGQTAAQPQGQPGGWGAPQGDQQQRERIQTQVAPSPAEQVGAAFGAGAQQQAKAIQQGDYGPVGQTQQPAAGGWGPGAQPDPAPQEAPKTTRTRAPRGQTAPAPAPNPTEPAPFDNSAAIDAAAQVIMARVEVLKLAFADPTMPMDEGLAVADDLWKWAATLPR